MAVYVSYSRFQLFTTPARLSAHLEAWGVHEKSLWQGRHSSVKMERMN